MFITFEGIDGCGKSTQAKRLFEHMSGRGAALLTREPGGWDGGETLREMVISGGLRHGWSEFFLFMLDRAEHAARVIEPALAADRTVICERYHDSTLAYQSWGRGLPLAPLEEMAKAASLPVPDVTVLFAIEPELAIKRVGLRGRPDSFEREGLAFMKKIDAGYRALAAREPRRWAIIECGRLNENDVFSLLLKELAERGADV